MKECKGCGELKAEWDFPARSDRSGRIRPYCKNCCNNINRVRYEAHKRDNPFLHKCTRAKSRAASLGTPFDLTPEHLEEIWTGVCPVTGEQIFLHERNRSDEFAAELDRFVPSLGYTIGNVAFLSRRANRLKNNATTKELRQLINWMEQYENR